MNLAILIGVFIAGLAVGVPVAVTLGLASLAYLLSAGIPLVVMPQKMYAGIDVFVLLCIPGFILAGNLMNSGGIYHQLVMSYIGRDLVSQLLMCQSGRIIQHVVVKNVVAYRNQIHPVARFGGF